MTFVVAVIILENDIAVTIITVGVTIFISVFFDVWTRDSEKAQAIEQQIREKKTPIYEKFIKLAFEIIGSGPNKLGQEQNELAQRREQKDATKVKNKPSRTPVRTDSRADYLGNR